MHIGMVSTRFAGLDGVSLESTKVADALAEDGHSFAWFAGELGATFTPGTLDAAAHFEGPENQLLQAEAFAAADAGDLLDRISAEAAKLQRSMEQFIERFGLDVLVVQNALAIPMQLPLGLALATVIHQSGIPAVAHHHDFGWERERFVVCAVPDILDRCFPPVAPNLAHLVINRDAQDELLRRRHVESLVLPNVMDFERGPQYDGHGNTFRGRAGLSSSDVVLLQPTRVIERKGIEHTIDLAARLSDPAVKVVVTHGGDLSADYWRRLAGAADDADVDLRLVPAGDYANALADAYAAADLVCFPSLYEGFGNALLEAFFFQRPVFVNRYSVYARDIAPTGVECVEIDGAVTNDAVARVERWLSDPSKSRVAIARNYEAGLEHFSYRSVREAYTRAFKSVGLTA